MVGEDEYLRFPSNEVVAIERGHRGIVIVNAGGHKDIEFGTRLRQGTYENRATADCSLTVSNGQLNGQIPDKSIIVLYKDESQPAQESTKTIFKAHYDVGMDNFLSLRGNVQPLSWHKGIAMDWTEGNVWVFETEELPVSADIEFKVLFNDRDWEKGMNHRVRGGEATDFTPRF